MQRVKKDPIKLQLAFDYLAQGNPKRALEICKALLMVEADLPEVLFAAAIGQTMLGDINGAKINLIKAIQLDSTSCKYHAHLAKVYILEGRLRLARSTINEARKLDTNLNAENRNKKGSNGVKNAQLSYQADALTLDTIATVYSRLNEHIFAKDYYLKAINKNSKRPDYWFNLGSTLRFLGDFLESKRALEECIKLAPNFSQAHFLLAEVSDISDKENHVERLKKLLEQPSSRVNKLVLAHALASEQASLGDHSASFDSLSKEKSARRKELFYQVETDLEKFDDFKRLNLNTTFFDTPLKKTPIFVLGMPRSGTTVVERMISSSPRVESAGELNCLNLAVAKQASTNGIKHLSRESIRNLEKIDLSMLRNDYLKSANEHLITDAPYFIDKMPLNFFFIELIKKAIPESKIVVLHRNPLDTCIGNFKALFSTQFSMYNYALDINNIASYIVRFTDLMSHFKRNLNDQMYIVDYEALVKNPVREGRDLTEFCGLLWKDEFVDIRSNTSAVTTASSVQVRRAINTRSIGRWKRYEQKLSSVKDYFYLMGLIDETDAKVPLN